MDFPLYFINLDRDLERRKLLEEQLQTQGLQGQRLNAIWWNSVATDEQSRLYSPTLNSKRYYKQLVNGEKGCYASHIKAWETLLSSDAQAIVILEDDVRLTDGFQESLQAISQLSESWDMVKLLSRPHEKIRAERSLTPTHKLIQYQRVPSWTAGYVISRSGAKKLLRSRVPFGRPIDVDIRFWFENDLHVFGVYPSVLTLDELSEVSSIWAQKEDRMTLSQRMRKLKMKIQLFWGNWLARKPKLP